MPSLASPEAPELQLNYGQLSPDIHRAVERIATRRTDEAFRVDGITPATMEPITQLLHATEGDYLPTYIHDEDGNYIQSGSTPRIEERHARVAVLDHQADQSQLWLRVPRYNTVPEEVPTSGHNRLGKKEIVALGAAGVGSWALEATAFATEKASLGVAGSLLAGSAVLYATRRLMGPILRQP